MATHEWQRPKEPDLELPAWWDDALNGDFRVMDRWLQEGSSLTAEKNIPYELLMGVNVDMMKS